MIERACIKSIVTDCRALESGKVIERTFSSTTAATMNCGVRMECPNILAFAPVFASSNWHLSIAARILRLWLAHH